MLNNSVIGNQAVVNFNSPNSMHHNPRVVAATFDTGVTAGLIYHDGSCSCREYSVNGDCVHAQSFRHQFEMALIFDVESTQMDASVYAQ